MARKKKVLKCIIDIKIKAVSCPGVWLDSKNHLYVNLFMFGLYAQTIPHSAVFPVLILEKFRFEKAFPKTSDPAAVTEKLEDEGVYIELVQGAATSRNEKVLATYSCNARDFLFPLPILRPSYNSLGREILLDTTSEFPGIISPKMEFSTSSVIKESTRYSVEETSSSLRSSHTHQKHDSMSGQIQHSFSNSRSLEPKSRSGNAKKAHKFSSEVLVDDGGYREKDTCCTVCRLYRKYFGRNYIGHHHPPFTEKSQVIGSTLKTGHQPRSITPNDHRRASSASPWREYSKGYFPDYIPMDSVVDSFRDMSFESDSLKKNKSTSNLRRHVYEWKDNTEFFPTKKSTKVFFDDNLALEDSDLSYKHLPFRSTYLYDSHYV
ncbi:uncharacterized protein LOC143244861 isoform X2 [Tachypleus tridentatus]|uniref:uncharacterized protein LOC143244861 isoform X2 n=1 Tax=Tachypleus tridentatus TaxID=6853 RepID=UPI003FCFDE15